MLVDVGQSCPMLPSGYGLSRLIETLSHNSISSVGPIVINCMTIFQKDGIIILGATV